MIHLTAGCFLVHGLELFTDEMYKFSKKKINGKNTSGTEASKKKSGPSLWVAVNASGRV